MAEAEETFQKRLSGQSKTLEDAVIEYRRRYGREPPRGFGEWWQFAQEHNVKLVDDFDAIHEDLAPFWVGELPSIDLVRIVDGRSERTSVDTSSGEHGARAFGFLGLLKKFEHTLPNMYFPINSKAEGRIIVPWEHREFPNITRQNFTGMTTPDWREGGNVWEAYRRSCPPTSEARRLYSSYRNHFAESPKPFFGPAQAPEKELTFVRAVEDAYDYCSYPSAHTSQGHFFSDWRTIPVLYPVLSPAKAVGFLDIRIPSNFYLGILGRYTYGFDPKNPGHPNDVDEMETPWEEKSDMIFWRGADTGGGNTPPGFAPNYQRHRFLRMTHGSVSGNRTIVHADPLSSSSHKGFTTTTVPARALNNDIMDTAFVKSTSQGKSYPGGLEELHRRHRFSHSVPLGEHWRHKYLLDLDGMGYSGRFMAFLASESAVLKSTVWREYLSEWLQPWLHYIPLSASYAELYNIHAYFSGPSPSTLELATRNMNMNTNLTVSHSRSLGADDELQRIARAGKQWKKTIGRVEDMEAYVYRLCLEYARLWADDRDSMNFEL
ncbi:hypothetical protein M405DRAFT_933602 [Rhizopogon salebrosus TDB-379]|nr:hypothetical protein M405DRAFT_933602 [Rhizopogon salebrosus TDB-379]